MTKPALFAALCAMGGAIASAFGGWDAALKALIFFMATDYVTGLIVAGIFKKSDKSESGGLESRAGFKGLLRKGMTLVIVFIAAQIDHLSGMTFVRNSTVVAFVTNEALSILENAGLMGVPMLPVITNALEVLRRRADSSAETKPGD